MLAVAAGVSSPVAPAPSAPSASPRSRLAVRLRPRLPALLARASLLLVSLLLLEAFSALLYAHLPAHLDNGRRLVDAYIAGTPPATRQLEAHPYLLYQNARGFRADGFVQTDSLRYRGPEVSPTKPAGCLRVLALGGSTTYGYPWIKDPAQTWPAQVQRLLRERHPGLCVEVVNAGLVYATSAELLASFVFRHQYLDPDIVIFHEGGNDVIPLMFPRYDPEYMHFRAHGTGGRPRPGEAALLRWSRFARVLYAVWLNSRESVYQSEPYGLAKLDRAEALRRVESNPSEGFRRNVDTLMTLAEARGARVILMGFVQGREPNIARGRPDLRGLEHAMVVGVAKHDRILAELAARHHTIFLRPPQDAFRDEWFVDSCHLDARGDRVKAQIVTAAIEREDGDLLRTHTATPPTLLAASAGGAAASQGGGR